MSNRKRFLAIALVIAMVFSSMAMGVSANTTVKFSDVPASDKQLTQALGVLGDLGIVAGTGTDEDGNKVFSGDAPVNRQQFALFVARITTGTPDFFRADEEALADVQALFPNDTDLTDATYATAIKYCYEKGIIQGVGGGKFSPLAPITIQDALKMLVSALGHTGLQYPTGYLARATEHDVALIGNHVVTTGFDFADVFKPTGDGPTYQLTRNDMAKLLYNFLLSSYSEVQLAWNGVTGTYIGVNVPVPVISKFGITPVVGYITGVVNYAADINVADYDNLNGVPASQLVGTGIGGKRPASFTGQPITERQAAGVTGQVTVPFDIQVKYRTWNGDTGTYGAINYGWNNEVEIRTTMDALGLEKTAPANNYLGLKVIVYQRNAVNIQHTVLPSAIVLGEKTLTKKADNKSEFDLRSAPTDNMVPELKVSNVKDLTLGNDTDVPFVFNQRTDMGMTKDLSLTYNLYAWNNDGYLVPDAVRATGLNAPALYEGSIEQELAKMVKHNGHYELWFVDNGINRNGEREFFYEFIPYKVAYLRDSGNVNLNDSVNFNQIDKGLKTATANLDGAVVYNDMGATKGEPVLMTAAEVTAAKKAGYLYTATGAFYKDVVLKEKLTEAVTDQRVYTVTDGSIYFETAGIASKVFNFAGSAKALGSIYAHNVQNKFEVGKAYSVYEDANKVPLLARETRGRQSIDAKWEYAVVVDTTKIDPADGTIDTTQNYMVVGYPDGTYGIIVEVYNSTSSTRETIIAKPNNNMLASDRAVAMAALRNLEPGEFLALDKQSDGSYATYTITTSATALLNYDHVQESDANTIGTSVGKVKTLDMLGNKYAAEAYGTRGSATGIEWSDWADAAADPALKFHAQNWRVSLRANDATLSPAYAGTKFIAPAPVGGETSGQLAAITAQQTALTETVSGGPTVIAGPNTKIIVYSRWATDDYDEIADAISGSDVTAIGPVATSFDRSVLTGSNDMLSKASRAVIVGSTNAAISVAEAIFISTEALVSEMVSPPRYGVVIDTVGGGTINIKGKWYSSKKAYVLGNNKEEWIYYAVEDAAKMATGSLVVLTTTINQAQDGRDYTWVELADSTLTGTGRNYGSSALATVVAALSGSPATAAPTGPTPRTTFTAALTTANTNYRNALEAFRASIADVFGLVAAASTPYAPGATGLATNAAVGTITFGGLDAAIVSMLNAQLSGGKATAAGLNLVETSAILTATDWPFASTITNGMADTPYSAVSAKTTTPLVDPTTNANGYAIDAFATLVATKTATGAQAVRDKYAAVVSTYNAFVSAANNLATADLSTYAAASGPAITLLPNMTTGNPDTNILVYAGEVTYFERNNSMLVGGNYINLIGTEQYRVLFVQGKTNAFDGSDPSTWTSTNARLGAYEPTNTNEGYKEVKALMNIDNDMWNNYGAKTKMYAVAHVNTNNPPTVSAVVAITFIVVDGTNAHWKWDGVKANYFWGS